MKYKKKKMRGQNKYLHIYQNIKRVDKDWDRP